MSRITFRLADGREVYVGDHPADSVEIYHDGLVLGPPVRAIDTAIPDRCPACAGRNITNLSGHGRIPVWVCDDCIPF